MSLLPDRAGQGLNLKSYLGAWCHVGLLGKPVQFSPSSICSRRGRELHQGAKALPDGIQSHGPLCTSADPRTQQVLRRLGFAGRGSVGLASPGEPKGVGDSWRQMVAMR